MTAYPVDTPASAPVHDDPLHGMKSPLSDPTPPNWDALGFASVAIAVVIMAFEAGLGGMVPVVELTGVRGWLLGGALALAIGSVAWSAAIVVVTVWHRLPWTPWKLLALLAVAVAVGIEGRINQGAIGLSAAMIGAMATTNYWVLAETTTGLVLLRSSRIRQYAKQVVKHLGITPSIEMVGSTVITSDWRIDGTMYSVTKRWESPLRQLAVKYRPA